MEGVATSESPRVARPVGKSPMGVGVRRPPGRVPTAVATTPAARSSRSLPNTVTPHFAVLKAQRLEKNTVLTSKKAETASAMSDYYKTTKPTTETNTTYSDTYADMIQVACDDVHSQLNDNTKAVEKSKNYISTSNGLLNFVESVAVNSLKLGGHQRITELTAMIGELSVNDTRRSNAIRNSVERGEQMFARFDGAKGRISEILRGNIGESLRVFGQRVQQSEAGIGDRETSLHTEAEFWDNKAGAMESELEELKKITLLSEKDAGGLCEHIATAEADLNSEVKLENESKLILDRVQSELKVAQQEVNAIEASELDAVRSFENLCSQIHEEQTMEEKLASIVEEQKEKVATLAVEIDSVSKGGEAEETADLSVKSQLMRSINVLIGEVNVLQMVIRTMEEHGGEGSDAPLEQYLSDVAEARKCLSVDDECGAQLGVAITDCEQQLNVLENQMADVLQSIKEQEVLLEKENGEMRKLMESYKTPKKMFLAESGKVLKGGGTNVDSEAMDVDFENEATGKQKWRTSLESLTPSPKKATATVQWSSSASANHPDKDLVLDDCSNVSGSDGDVVPFSGRFAQAVAYGAFGAVNVPPRAPKVPPRFSSPLSVKDNDEDAVDESSDIEQSSWSINGSF